ncbi:hypothetical protein EUTSA_v10024175mg [Eutrema salsugineum]|uniref:Uncharacterized protein n=1 Tax=Eutrema salsugineum TaxID=72664 RepID=V4KCK7_EUTSA|nr:hypothetical protein EUTSA_v10024175mg [Eutrema salsugineum]
MPFPTPFLFQNLLFFPSLKLSHELRLYDIAFFVEFWLIDLYFVPVVVDKKEKMKGEPACESRGGSSYFL